jgi:hypothetical protein
MLNITIDPLATDTIRIVGLSENTGILVFGVVRRNGDVVRDVPRIDALAMVRRGKAQIVS